MKLDQKKIEKASIGVLLILIVFFVYVLANKQKFNNQVLPFEPKVSFEPLSAGELSVQEGLWKNRFDQVDPSQAYSEFKKTFANANFGSQHVMAHFIGSEIYGLSGINGINVCDSTFAFGCYHGYFSQILSQEGLSVIKMLDETCVSKFGPLGSGCQHGIGHGVMDYFGPNKLVDALESCKDTTTPSPVAGCTSGVFMEYFVPILISDTGAEFSSRPFDELKPYEACPNLPKHFRQSCYYAIGQWWNQTFMRRDYSTQGLLCKNMPDNEFMEDCYLGIGNVVAPDSAYNVDKSIAWCKQMPDLNSIVLCQAGASWSFDANPDYRKLAVLMCGQLQGEEEAACVHKAHLLNPENTR